MNPKQKIIDAQEFARYLDTVKDDAGNVKYADIVAWLIGANNHIQHGHGRYLKGLDTVKAPSPFVVAWYDIDESILFDKRTFDEKVLEYIKTEGLLTE